MKRRLVLIGVWILAAGGLAGSSAAQERPLPDKETFLREARGRLQTDEERQSGYVYLETQRRTKLDGQGRPKGESLRVTESYPGLPGEARWDRVLVDDGRKLTEAELRRQDAERQKKAEEFLRKRAKQTEAERARERARRAQEAREQIDDVFRVFEMQLVRREAIKGHDTILISLTPRPNVATRSPSGKWLKHFQGRVWISESDYELVRMEVEAIRDVSVGLGLLARVHKGGRAAFERTKVNGEAWLPARAEYTISGRIMLFRRLREGGIAEFSNYRKFGVSTETTYGPPRTQK